MSAVYDATTGLSFGIGQQQEQGVFAEFELTAVQNNFKTAQEGRPIFEDKVYIRIRTAGDRLNEVHREAKDQDKRRFPLQWARYVQGQEQATEGTPLEQWPLMTPGSVRSLKALNVNTVEQLAAVTDGNLDHLGMGARNLREQAQAYLARANEGAALRQATAENQNLRDEIEALKANVANLAAASRKKEATDDGNRTKPGNTPEE